MARPLRDAASNHVVKMLAQLLRQNGGCQVTIAAPKGLKMELAKSLDAADTYIELSRESPEAQFEQLKKDNPYGFDIGQSIVSSQACNDVLTCGSRRGHWLRQDPRGRHQLRPPWRHPRRLWVSLPSSRARGMADNAQCVLQLRQGLVAPIQDLWRRDHHHRLLLRDIHVP